MVFFLQKLFLVTVMWSRQGAAIKATKLQNGCTKETQRMMFLIYKFKEIRRKLHKTMEYSQEFFVTRGCCVDNKVFKKYSSMVDVSLVPIIK